MYETVEIFDDNNSLYLRDILKSCIYNYYNNKKNGDNNLQFNYDYHIINATNNKLHNMKGE